MESRGDLALLCGLGIIVVSVLGVCSLQNSEFDTSFFSPVEEVSGVGSVSNARWGVSYTVVGEPGFDCDNVLRQQLVFQHGVNTAALMNEVVSQIQDVRPECPSHFWGPVAVDVVDGFYNGGCFDSEAEARSGMVGGQMVPDGLMDVVGSERRARFSSGRDFENNLIIHWGGKGQSPWDGARCWLYVSRLRSWSETY